MIRKKKRSLPGAFYAVRNANAKYHIKNGGRWSKFPFSIVYVPGEERNTPQHDYLQSRFVPIRRHTQVRDVDTGRKYRAVTVASNLKDAIRNMNEEDDFGIFESNWDNKKYLFRSEQYLTEKVEMDEFNPETKDILPNAYVGEEEEGKNFVHTISGEGLSALIEAYKDREENEQWLWHLFTDEKFKFPGRKEVCSFVEQYLADNNVFDEDTWTNYIKFTLTNAENKNIFKLDMDYIPEMPHDELPLPFEEFKKFFLALYKRMPKIIWVYTKDDGSDEQQTDKEEGKNEEKPKEETKKEPKTKEQYQHLNDFRKRKAQVKKKIEKINPAEGKVM